VKYTFGFEASLAATGFALAIACSGCAAAGAAGLVTTVLPMVAAGGAQVVSAGVAMKENGGTGVPKDEESDRCDQLLRVPPGIEEVRKTKDGLIESRQWKIEDNVGTPAWMLVAEKSAPQDSWQLKPNIARLNFNPPLYQMLETDKPQFLAYAPADVVNPTDSEQFDSMTSAFGPGVGTFQWRGRSYSYVVVKELPCFKPAT
jgi:hypothetical protein